MHTIKSACLIVVLLGVLYGVYVALNKPDLGSQPVPSTTDEAPPLNIEYNSSSAPVSAAPAPLAAGSDPAASPLPTPERNIRGGAFQPSPDGVSPASHTVPATDAARPYNDSQRAAYEAAPALAASESPAVPAAETGSPAATVPASSLSPAAPQPALAAYDLRRDLAAAEQHVSSGKFKSALATLSQHCTNSNLPSDERAVLFSWLDALAAKVIYSPEHLLAPPHQVRQGEDLYKIAQQYNVEYRLLQSINHREVRDPQVLVPSTELKVVPGPFRAEVSLTTGEIMVFLNDCYAGRFPFVLGDQPPRPGDYHVIDKRSQQKTYVGFDNRVIPANDPGNPYGGWWISLGGEVAIHGSALTPGAKTLGCISLSPRDAQDVYGILSVGSEVRILP